MTPIERYNRRRQFPAWLSWGLVVITPLVLEFGFQGTSQLLLQSYTPQERARMQGTFFFQAINEPSHMGFKLIPTAWKRVSQQSPR